jgi:LysM repeat protein
VTTTSGIQSTGGLIPRSSQDNQAIHRVQPGDTLASIAAQKSIDVASLREANPSVGTRGESTLLVVGQELTIPPPKAPAVPAEPAAAPEERPAADPQTTADSRRVAQAAETDASRRVGQKVPALQPAPTGEQIRAGAVMERGQSGEPVSNVQKMLTQAGFPVQSTGTFGPTTEETVRKFQNAHGIADTGKVGAQTLDALTKASSGGGPLNNRIKDAAENYRGRSTAAGPDGGNNACAWSLNNVLRNAGVSSLGSNPNWAPDVEASLKQRGVLINPADAQPGDIVMAGDQSHVGICLGNGRVLSNSSSNASFSWESGLNFDGARGASRVYRLQK